MSAAPTQGGLTQALGGRRAFCCCAVHRHESSASVGPAFRKALWRVAASCRSAGRAHTSHAVRSPASETAISLRQVSQLQMRSLRKHPAESSRVRAQAARLRFSARSPQLHPRRHPARLTSRSSRPRVVASAMCYALRLHMSAAPPQGGLTQALGLSRRCCVARRKNPLGGSFLNRLSFFKSKPINRDARKLVEPLDPSRKKKVKSKPGKAKSAKIKRTGKQALLANPKKQVCKKDGSIVKVPSRKA